MPEVHIWKNRQINSELARTFREIVTAGWANKSSGSVESPTGAFALVLIDPSELTELVEACEIETPLYPGSYLVVEDSDGNTELIEYLNHQRAKEAYRHAEREYAIWSATCPKCGSEGPHDRLSQPTPNSHQCACGEIWDPTGDEPTITFEPGDRPEGINTVDNTEKMYLVCKNCGEAFDTIETAHEHGTVNPQSQVWCGEDGFDLLPESEAM